MKQLIYHFIFAACIVFASCSDSSSEKEEKPLDTVTNPAEALPENGNTTKTSVHPGKAVYDKYCLVCHLSDGSGIAGMFPPLTPNEYINDKDKLMDVVLNGMSGKIEVNGETYNNFMAPHSHLTDEELANVISYVRSSFGNDLGPVTKEEVNAARKK